MHFKYTNGKDEDFVLLCTQLDDSLNEAVGGIQNRMQYLAHNLLHDINDVVVVYDNETPIACGSFKKFDEQAAEIKRVFVNPQYRRQGLAQKCMDMLQTAAKQQGYTALVLETGKELPGAIKLYADLGFYTIPNYGPYVDMAESVCMKKDI